MVRTPILIHYGCKFRSPQHWFTSLEDAQLTLNAWRHDYNNVRPHSSLGQQAPAHFGSGGDVSLAHTLVELWALKTSMRIPVHRERPFRSNVNTDSDRW